jgi:hypothetical protein
MEINYNGFTFELNYKWANLIKAERASGVGFVSNPGPLWEMPAIVRMAHIVWAGIRHHKEFKNGFTVDEVIEAMDPDRYIEWSGGEDETASVELEFVKQCIPQLEITNKKLAEEYRKVVAKAKAQQDEKKNPTEGRETDQPAPESNTSESSS